MARLRAPVTKADHAQGRANAPLVLVEYGDYECPHCGRAYPIVKQVQRVLGDELLFVFRNFPLAQIHPHAMKAAAAAEAAGLQGQFWEMHDLLFENQARLDDQSLLAYAASLDLDVDRFVADAGSDAVAERIAADVEGGARSGVNGTPTFFANGVRVDGDWDYDSLLLALRKPRTRDTVNASL
jgi:protein-disulfide isomerase